MKSKLESVNVFLINSRKILDGEGLSFSTKPWPRSLRLGLGRHGPDSTAVNALTLRLCNFHNWFRHFTA